MGKASDAREKTCVLLLLHLLQLLLHLIHKVLLRQRAESILSHLFRQVLLHWGGERGRLCQHLGL